MNILGEGKSHPVAQKSKRTILFVLIYCVAVLLMGYVAYYVARPKTTTPVSNGPVLEPTLEQTQEALLLAAGKLKFAPAAERIGIFPIEVPRGIALFVPTDAAELTMSHVTRTDGSKGYSIAFSVPAPLKLSYKSFLDVIRANADWKMLGASRANQAALIDTQSSAYAVRVNLVSKNSDVASSTLVQLEVISQ